MDSYNLCICESHARKQNQKGHKANRKLCHCIYTSERAFIHFCIYFVETKASITKTVVYLLPCGVGDVLFCCYYY